MFNPSHQSAFVQDLGVAMDPYNPLLKDVHHINVTTKKLGILCSFTK